MSAYLLLLVCMGLGWLFAHVWRMPENTPAVLNAWIMRIALPALILVQIPRLEPDSSLLLPALAPWWVALGALVLMPWLGRRFGWTRGTVGCLILTAGLGNTSFAGLPLILALRGSDALGPAVIADQFGSFLGLSTLGVLVASVWAGGRASLREMAHRILRFPPFAALPVAGLAMWAGGWPGVLETVLERLAETLTPIALFVVGMQFNAGDARHHLRELGAGLGWKMVVAPLAVALFAWATGQHGLPADIAVMQTAMAPMVTAGILAQQSGLAPRLANSMVSLGLLVSLLTVPLWSLLLG